MVAYYQSNRAAGKSHREALRCLKRRLFDAVCRRLVRDAHHDGPGRTPGGDDEIQRARLNPNHRLFGSVTPRTRRHQPYQPHTKISWTREAPKSTTGSEINHASGWTSLRNGPGLGARGVGHRSGMGYPLLRPTVLRAGHPLSCCPRAVRD